MRRSYRAGARVFAIVLDDYHVSRPQELRIIPALRAFVERLPAVRQFARETGGIPIVNTNNFRGGLERIARDSSANYLLAYESPHPAHDSS